MKSNGVESRNYSMTDPEFCTMVSNLVNSLRNDAVEFADFGVTDAVINDLESKIDAYKIFPPDYASIGDIIIASDAKKDLHEALIAEARNIGSRAKSKWGEDSTQFKKFMIYGLSSLNDREFYFQVRRVHNVGTEYLAELASEGLTQEILDDFAAMIQSYEDSLNDYYNMLNAREENARQRVRDGNEIYGLVVKYCEIGKRIWVNSNSAKYKRYCIYHGYKTKKKKAVAENKPEDTNG